VLFRSTASALVMQLVDSGELDAAIVYEANCAHVRDRADVIPINHPMAVAIQPIAVNKTTKYPRLMGRLIDALTSESAKVRFEEKGFEWLWSQPEAAGP